MEEGGRAEDEFKGILLTSSPLRAFSPKKSPLWRFLMNFSSAAPASFLVTFTRPAEMMKKVSPMAP